MQLTAQAIANQMTALVASEGNLPVELDVEVVDVDGKAHKLSAKAYSIQVQQREANTPVIVISSNDLSE
jgi:hypothetical protein